MASLKEWFSTAFCYVDGRMREQISEIKQLGEDIVGQERRRLGPLSQVNIIHMTYFYINVRCK